MTQFKGGKHPCKWIFLTATNKMRLVLKLLDICLAVKKSLPPWSWWKCHFLPVIIDHLWISHTAAFEVKPVWYLLLKAQQAKLRFNDIRTIFSLSRDFKKKRKEKKRSLCFSGLQYSFPSCVMNRWLISEKTDHLAAENPSTTFTEKVNNLH